VTGRLFATDRRLQLRELFERGVFEQQGFAKHTCGDGEHVDVAVRERDDRRSEGEAAASIRLASAGLASRNSPKWRISSPQDSILEPRSPRNPVRLMPP
jgi:hypothetical protein